MTVLLDLIPRNALGIYIHWPFCQAKCPYCDFNSHVVGSIDQDRWLKAYQAELRRYAAGTSDRPIGSVFFGGGTPSLMDGFVVEGVLSEISRLWRMANDVEITLEANPTSVEASRFRAYRTAGVNRVSLGVQALSDPDLRRLGRIHSVDEALSALDVAQGTFDRVSFDLIYARQDQSREAWSAELSHAISLGTSHLSLYQLTIEPGTAFGARFDAGALRGLPDDDLAADLYDITQTQTYGAGLEAYEVSNHARAGHESRHNLIYWTGGDYLGIGPGAHGRLTADGVRFATETHLEPMYWLNAVEKSGSGESLREPLDGAQQRTEAILMGLRTDVGISAELVEKSIKFNDLKDDALIQHEDGRVRLTKKGRPLLNAVAEALLLD